MELQIPIIPFVNISNNVLIEEITSLDVYSKLTVYFDSLSKLNRFHNIYRRYTPVHVKLTMLLFGYNAVFSNVIYLKFTTSSTTITTHISFGLSFFLLRSP